MSEPLPSLPGEPKPSMCSRCDFGSGTRGMDRCSKCAGTGSVFRVIGKDGLRSFPNTREGFDAAVAYGGKL